MSIRTLFLCLTLSTAVMTYAAQADTPQQILAGFTQQATQESADFQGFSVERGALFFNNTHANDWSCASCHTQNPAVMGKHAKTGKAIDPLAPSANAERFTDVGKVEKWFKRNCNDVVDRPCTVTEKGDVLSYLLSVK